MKTPWYRSVLSGQGRKPGEAEELANALLIAACLAVVGLFVILGIVYL